MGEFLNRTLKELGMPDSEIEDRLMELSSHSDVKEELGIS